MNFSFLLIPLQQFLNKKIVLFLLLGSGWVGGAVGLGWGVWQLHQTVYPPLRVAVPEAGAADTPQLGHLVVEIAGAVAKPGLYTVEFGSRWGHALDQAGGLLPEADVAYIQSQLNLADRPTDGAKLYIPYRDELAAARPSLSPRSTLLNLNTATAAELDALPGVGEKTVEAIVGARPFSNISELLSKKIVGEKTFAELQPLVTAP